MGKQVGAAILYIYEDTLKTYLFWVQFPGPQKNGQQTKRCSSWAALPSILMKKPVSFQESLTESIFKLLSLHE